MAFRMKCEHFRQSWMNCENCLTVRWIMGIRSFASTLWLLNYVSVYCKMKVNAMHSMDDMVENICNSHTFFGSSWIEWMLRLSLYLDKLKWVSECMLCSMRVVLRIRNKLTKADPFTYRPTYINTYIAFNCTNPFQRI